MVYLRYPTLLKTFKWQLVTMGLVQRTNDLAALIDFRGPGTAFSVSVVYIFISV